MIIIFRRAREWTSLHKQFEWEIMISSLCQSVWHGELRSAMSRASFRQWKSLKFHPFSQSEYLFSCLLLIFARISSEAERGWRFLFSGWWRRSPNILRQFIFSYHPRAVHENYLFRWNIAAWEFSFFILISSRQHQLFEMAKLAKNLNKTSKVSNCPTTSWLLCNVRQVPLMQ